MRVVHIGAFDHDSYGDLLFPLIFEWRLRHLPCSVSHAAPTAGAVPWKEAVPVITIRQALHEQPAWSGVVIGGGDTVADGSLWLPHWNQADCLGPLAMPQLWAGAGYIALMHDAHLLWNAPGVPFLIEGEARKLMAWTLSVSEYVSVRTAGSAAHLNAEGENAVSVVPDTAFDLSRMWAAETLTPEYKRFFETYGRRCPELSVSIFVNTTFVPASIADAAEAIGAVCLDRNATAVLGNLCPWSRAHDTEELADILEKNRIPCVSMPRPHRLRDVAALIAHSDMHLGSSLHGVISALSYGKPAIAVVPPCAISRRKVEGTLSLCGAESLVVDDWRQVSQRYVRLREEGEGARFRIDGLFDALDHHWARIEAILRSPRPHRTDSANQSLATLNEPWSMFEYMAFGGLLARHVQHMSNQMESHFQDAQRLADVQSLLAQAREALCRLQAGEMSCRNRLRGCFRKGPHPLLENLLRVHSSLERILGPQE